MGKHFSTTTTKTVEFSCRPIGLASNASVTTLPAIRMKYELAWMFRASILALSGRKPADQSRRRIE